MGDIYSRPLLLLREELYKITLKNMVSDTDYSKVINEFEFAIKILEDATHDKGRD